MSEQKIDIGDTVFHRPTGENWLVARVDYDRGELMWMGWPCGWARINDCELKEKATPEKRHKILEEIAASSHGEDPRVSTARYRRLSEINRHATHGGPSHEAGQAKAGAAAESEAREPIKARARGRYAGDRGLLRGGRRDQRAEGGRDKEEGGMKVIGTTSAGYVCEVSHTEIEKFLDLYYGKKAHLQCGEEVDLAAGYDWSAKIEIALSETQRFVQANQPIIQSLMSGYSVLSTLADRRTP